MDEVNQVGEVNEGTLKDLGLELVQTTVEDDEPIGSDEDIDTGSGDESDNESDSNFETDEQNDVLVDLDVWQRIGKTLEDFNADDMKQLSFKDHQSCIQFYKRYARATGFGIRRKNSIKSRVDGHYTSQLIWCNREGFRASRYLEKKDRRRTSKPITRCGCKALISFKWDFRADYWKVNRFVEEHVHDLVPDKHISFVRSHREITEADRIRIQSLIASGVRPCITMRNMAVIAGGRNKVGFLKSDLYNALEKFKKDEIKNGDTETVLAYLLGKNQTDPSFFIRVDRDQNNDIDKMFWCDGRCRLDYRAFGTVIAFDTTYKVNAYNKPLVVIVGVNHHLQTVPFGVALVSNETEVTYRWVLQQLLEAGGNNAPYTVITDGDKTMANAIKAIFPNARHRLCLWHLMRNVKTRGNKRICSGFMKCVDGCSTPSEFEEAWEDLMSEYNIGEQQWARELYEKKEKWSEAFLHGHFFAGMRSTQRCESMNSTLKTVFTKKIMLYRFVKLYDKVLDNIRFEENYLDYLASHTFPVIQGVLPKIKAHAARVYTRSAFSLFCKELEYESRHVVVKCERKLEHNDGPTFTYWLAEDIKKTAKYVVMYNLRQQIMCCCCAKLESIGFPCRHMFAVMKYEGIVEIPDGCILRRWTMKAKSHLSDTSHDVELEKDEERSAVTGRFAFMINLSTHLCRMASTSYERSHRVTTKLTKLIKATTRDMTTPKVKDKDTPYGKSNRKGKGKGKSKGDNVNKNKGKSANKKANGDEFKIEFKENEDNYTTACDSDALFVNADFGPGFSFVNLLKQFMPRTYNPGEAKEAKDCYEVSRFEKNTTVFDWEPKLSY